MIRTLIALLAALVIAPGMFAHPPPIVSRPAGVIAPPALPITGSLTPPGYTPARPLPRPYLAPNPYFNSWGFAPYWPTWYDANPVVINNNVFAIPAPAMVEPATVAPASPPDLRARLTLTVPSGARVWLAGNELDASVSPVILESPILRADQMYTFSLKVVWGESNQPLEERARAVTVQAGGSKSLAYFR
jgi:hypothetical protein